MQLWRPEFELIGISSGSWYHCLSHAHTVVWECCKDDQQSQWEMLKFDLQLPLNPYQTCQAVAGYGRHSHNSCSSRRTVCQQSAVARFLLQPPPSGTLYLTTFNLHRLFLPFTGSWRHSCFINPSLTLSSNFQYCTFVDFATVYAVLATLKILIYITFTLQAIVTKFGMRDYVIDIFHQEKTGLNPLRGFFSPYTQNTHPPCSLRYATLYACLLLFLVLPVAYSRDPCMDFNA